MTGWLVKVFCPNCLDGLLAVMGEFTIEESGRSALVTTITTPITFNNIQHTTYCDTASHHTMTPVVITIYPTLPANQTDHKLTSIIYQSSINWWGRHITND